MIEPREYYTSIVRELYRKYITDIGRGYTHINEMRSVKNSDLIHDYTQLIRAETASLDDDVRKMIDRLIPVFREEIERRMTRLERQANKLSEKLYAMIMDCD